MNHASTLPLFSGFSDNGNHGGALVAGAVRGVIGWVRLALAVRRERRALSRLSVGQLADDLGLDPEAAVREANRPFWDLPFGR